MERKNHQRKGGLHRPEGRGDSTGAGGWGGGRRRGNGFLARRDVLLTNADEVDRGTRATPGARRPPHGTVTGKDTPAAAKSQFPCFWVYTVQIGLQII